MTKTMTTTLGASAALAVVGFFATPAADAQEASSVSQFERPYGYGFGDESRPFDAGSRDINGNRVIVNGRIMTGTSTLSGDLNTMWGQTEGASGMLGSSSAIGNQLNVITNGSWNTIIIDSTQINNGDQTAILNGELDLND